MIEAERRPEGFRQELLVALDILNDPGRPEEETLWAFYVFELCNLRYYSVRVLPNASSSRAGWESTVYSTTYRLPWSSSTAGKGWRRLYRYSRSSCYRRPFSVSHS